MTTTEGRYTYKSQPVRYPVTPFDPTVLLYIAGGVLILALIYYPIHWYKQYRERLRRESWQGWLDAEAHYNMVTRDSSIFEVQLHDFTNDDQEEEDPTQQESQAPQKPGMSNRTKPPFLRKGEDERP